MKPPVTRGVIAEFLGTMFLLSAVVGSGIMAERLAQGNTALVLLANSLATGAALVALIVAFGPVSGAHFNPAVTLSAAIAGRMEWKSAPVYIAAQLFGAFTGVLAAHLMFGLPLFSTSHHERSGGAQIFSEAIATFGLLLVIASCDRFQSSAAPYAVGAYITAAYWFTSSTSFANPAVTLARMATDTFAGIRPMDAPGFLLGQLLGGGVALTVSSRLILKRKNEFSLGEGPRT